MPNVVLDSTILVSAFLTKKGLAAQLLEQAVRGAFDLYLCEGILQETQQVLLEREHLRTRYRYTDEEVQEFCTLLRGFAHVPAALPSLAGISRDPNDDMVIACALAAGAHYLITRDEDLLTLGTYQQVTILLPEAFIRIIREQARKR